MVLSGSAPDVQATPDVQAVLPHSAAQRKPRRIAALVLPELVVELAWSHFCTDTERRGGKLVSSRDATQPGSMGRLPFAVVVLEDQELEGEVPASAPLSAASEAARRFGVRSGQSITEACALVSNLIVQELPQPQIVRELQRLAEVALGFGASVSYEAPDTVWVDVTGAAHLRGGEEQLALQLADRVRQASAGGGGHTVRVVIAEGPRIAQAVARWGRLSREGVLVLNPEDTKAKLAELPVVALPLDQERTSWLSRLGLHSIGAVAELAPSVASSRLGEHAGQILDLCQGRDREPLVPYVPPELLVEQTSWDDAMDGLLPLQFVARGLVARLSSRLQGRGEAAQLLELAVLHDRSIARLRQVDPVTELRFELAAPLWREAELLRVVRSRLENMKLVAPSIGLVLRAPILTRAVTEQLDLAGARPMGKAGTRSVHSSVHTQGSASLPVLLAELVADLGGERVGVLELVDSHRPEERSRLVGVRSLTSKRKSKARGRRAAAKPTPVQALLPCGNNFEALELPTRLFSQPIALSNMNAAISPRARVSRFVPQLPSKSPALANVRPLVTPADRKQDRSLGRSLEPGSTLSFGRRLYTIAQARFESRLDGVEWWTSHPVSRDYWRLTLESRSEQAERASFDALVFIDRLTGGHFLQGIYD